jgi:hypothetical protein
MYNHSQQLKQEYKLMTDDGIYNTQNKAHRKRLLGYTGNATQRMQNMLKGTESVNNKNRNQNCNTLKSESVKAVLLKTHFLGYYVTLSVKLLQTF